VPTLVQKRSICHREYGPGKNSSCNLNKERKINYRRLPGKHGGLNGTQRKRTGGFFFFVVVLSIKPSALQFIYSSTESYISSPWFLLLFLFLKQNLSM
jgi:hypothetical protein